MSVTFSSRFRRSMLAVLIAVTTPLLEKNPAKTRVHPRVRLVFSMSRVVVLAFACAMLRQIWVAGIAGWPESTLAIAVVLALPLVNALERVRPEQVVALGKTLISRIGTGAVRDRGSVYTSDVREPTKFDDHWSDRYVER